MEKKIICDVCQNLFKIKEVIVMDLPDNKERLSFMCPHCKHIYPICVRTKSI